MKEHNIQPSVKRPQADFKTKKGPGYASI